MSDKPATDDDKLTDDEAEARFKRVVGNLINAPHKPHQERAASNSTADE